MSSRKKSNVVDHFMNLTITYADVAVLCCFAKCSTIYTFSVFSSLFNPSFIGAVSKASECILKH